MRPVPFLPSGFFKIHLKIILPSLPLSFKWSSSFRSPRQKPVWIFLHYSRHIPRPAHSPWFDDAKNISWTEQITKLLSLQFSSAHCHSLPLRHPILKQPRVMFLPQCDSPSIHENSWHLWQLSFSKRRGWRFRSSATWHWVNGWAVTKFRRIVLPSPSAVHSLRRMDSSLLAFEGEGITILRQVGRHSPKDNASKYLQLQSEPYVYWTVHHCDSWRIKDQLDVTCYFILLLMHSTCFGH